MQSTPRVDHIVACDPPEDCERLRGHLDPAVDVIAQRGDNLGGRLMSAFEDVFRLGAERVIVIGSDLPDLSSGIIAAAFDRLRRRGDRVVLGPADDGGYYLIGLKRQHPELFRGIDWSTPRVFAQTIDAAARVRLPVEELDRWEDIDEPAALQRLLARRGSAAPRTRAWATLHGIN